MTIHGTQSKGESHQYVTRTLAFHPSIMTWLFATSFNDLNMQSHMPMWHEHLQLDLHVKCVTTYDKELRFIHVAKIYQLDLDKDFPLDEVHVAINNNLKFYNNK